MEVWRRSSCGYARKKWGVRFQEQEDGCHWDSKKTSVSLQELLQEKQRSKEEKQCKRWRSSATRGVGHRSGYGKRVDGERGCQEAGHCSLTLGSNRIASTVSRWRTHVVGYDYCGSGCWRWNGETTWPAKARWNGRPRPCLPSRWSHAIRTNGCPLGARSHKWCALLHLVVHSAHAVGSSRRCSSSHVFCDVFCQFCYLFDLTLPSFFLDLFSKSMRCRCNWWQMIKMCVTISSESATSEPAEFAHLAKLHGFFLEIFRGDDDEGDMCYVQTVDSRICQVGTRAKTSRASFRTADVVVVWTACKLCWRKGQCDAVDPQLFRKIIIWKAADANSEETRHSSEEMITFKSGTNDDVVDMKFEVTDLRENAFGNDETDWEENVVMFSPKKARSTFTMCRRTTRSWWKKKVRRSWAGPFLEGCGSHVGRHNAIFRSKVQDRCMYDENQTILEVNEEVT